MIDCSNCGWTLDPSNHHEDPDECPDCGWSPDPDADNPLTRYDPYDGPETDAVDLIESGRDHSGSDDTE
jgi:hypothetical protein